MRPCKSKLKLRIIQFLLLVVFVALGIASPFIIPAVVWRNSETINIPEDADEHTGLSTNGSTPDYKIPAIIHQTWKTTEIPEKWVGARQACMDLHPEYEFKLWTDESARELIEKEYPCLLETFDRYPYGIQRADAIRYVLLYLYGGLYIDLDIECKKPLDFLRQYSFVMPQTMPVGFSNDFLGSSKGHPFAKQLADNLPKWRVNLLWKYPTVMFSTGPMFVTLQASLYARRRELSIISANMYGKYANSSEAIFVHLFGSSWHGEDAKSVLWIFKHRWFVVGMTAMALVGVAWVQRERLRELRLKMIGYTPPVLQQLKVCAE